MTFEEFQGKYAAAFGSTLTERHGLAEWRKFVKECKLDGLLMKALNDFATNYNAAVRDMSPYAKNYVPTLKALRDHFWDLYHARQTEERPSNGCPVCGGRGIVYALAPCKGDGDRQLAPEDWRTVPLDRAIPFAEAYNCPRCDGGGKFYAGKDFLRDRVTQNCLPEVVGADDPRNPYGFALGGDLLIRWALADRAKAEKLNGNGLVARDAAPAASFTPELDNDDLERQFPLEDERAEVTA